LRWFKHDPHKKDRNLVDFRRTSRNSGDVRKRWEHNEVFGLRGGQGHGGNESSTRTKQLHQDLQKSLGRLRDALLPRCPRDVGGFNSFPKTYPESNLAMENHL